MKKTLFALLALATMMPAMAENWKISDATVDICYIGETPDTDYTHYTLYWIEQQNSECDDVVTTIASKTLDEFLKDAGNGVAFNKLTSEDDVQYVKMTTLTETAFDSTNTDYSNIWGVSVYQSGGVAEFQVIASTKLPKTASPIIYFNTQYYDHSSYTSFKSSPSTPEPATATLSLLALAGLATRRRRK